MMLSLPSRHFLPLTAVVVVWGCSPTDLDTPDDDDLVAVGDGKADNFFSNAASEYYVDGVSNLVLDESYVHRPAADKLARARQLMGLKTIQIGWFLHVRLVDKEEGGGEHGDQNADTYPGFHALVRDGEYLNNGLTALPDGKSYTFNVRLQVAGQKQLLSKLPGTMIDATHKRFTLKMGRVSNTDLARLEAEHEWFRDDQWDSGTFDPTKLRPEELDPIELTISPQPSSRDAYPDINNLFADGRLTIDVHYGWDYWSRYDLSLSRELYQSLVEKGFRSPAPSYGGYRPQSGPLTKTINANGKPISVEIRIYHGSDDTGKVAGPNPDTDQGGLQMEKDMYASLAQSDVVVFSGHSGNYYGFALANWKKTARGALDYPQLRDAQMPRDRYQLVLASGCDTFSIGQAFRENPNKMGLANLDVITSTTFSNASSNDEIEALFAALFAHTSTKGRFVPHTYGELLAQMNGRWDIGAMYGVHGIDDNPRLHPFADVTTLGKSCTRNGQCGGDGNRCTSVGAKRVCSATCLDDSACPTGYRCQQVASTSSSRIVGRQCLK